MRTKSIEQSIKCQYTHDSTTILDYQPGNGSKYILHITCLDWLKDAPPTVIDRVGGNCFTVALLTEGHGTCMTVSDTGGYLSADYVAEKLKVGYPDAVVLSEIIAMFTGRTATDASEK
jgi:hypothetical protein